MAMMIGTPSDGPTGMKAVFRCARAALTLGLICAGAALGAAAPVHAQQVVALVNGEPITPLDVEQQTRIIEALTRKKPSRKEAIDELIDQKVKLHQARRLGISVDEGQVNRQLATMARNAGGISGFENALRQAGIALSAFKTKMRSDIAWREILQKMAPGSFQVRDADIVAALMARGEQPTTKAIQYTMRQVVFVVPRGSPDSVRAARVREAESLRAKFSSCEQDFHLAREYREVVVMDPVIRISTDLPERLRELLAKTPNGRMTPPEPTPSGIEVVAICNRKETVADLSSLTDIRQQLLSQRVDTQEKRILENLRRKAIIEYR